MNITEICYIIYLLIGVPLTVWVGQTLHRNGRIFLIEAFHGNKEMADSVNHLLLVGFYLINVGYVLLGLPLGSKPETVQGAFEFLAVKLGLVLLVLGAMHFFNMFNFDKMRKRARHNEAVAPPIAGAAPPPSNR
jgi:hypothetical protein